MYEVLSLVTCYLSWDVSKLKALCKHVSTCQYQLALLPFEGWILHYSEDSYTFYVCKCQSVNKINASLSIPSSQNLSSFLESQIILLSIIPLILIALNTLNLSPWYVLYQLITWGNWVMFILCDITPVHVLSLPAYKSNSDFLGVSCPPVTVSLLIDLFYTLLLLHLICHPSHSLCQLLLVGCRQLLSQAAHVVNYTLNA